MRENLIVNGIVADIIDFEADDVYDVGLIVRVLHILQRDKIQKRYLINKVLLFAMMVTI